MNARSPFVVGSILVVILIGLGALLLVRTGSGEPPAPPPPAEPSAMPTQSAGTPTAAPDPAAVIGDQSTTVLRIRVTDCDGCQVTGVTDTAGSGEHQWAATVANGVAQLEMPTANTFGIAFFVQGERDGNDTPTRTLVTLLPAGVQPGDPVTQAQVNAAKRGGYCWAGTTLDIAVLNFSARSQSGRVQQAWANPGLPALDPRVDLTARPDSAAKVACGTA